MNLTAMICRPFHGLDGLGDDACWGYALSRSFMLAPASQVEIQ